MSMVCVRGFHRVPESDASVVTDSRPRVCVRKSGYRRFPTAHGSVGVSSSDVVTEAMLLGPTSINMAAFISVIKMKVRT